MRDSDMGQGPEESRDSGTSQGSGRSYGSYQATAGNVEHGQVVMGHGNVVGDENIVAGEGAAAAGAGGAAATGQSAAATEGAAAAAGESSASVGVVERAQKSRWFKRFAVLAILATAAATGLLIAGVTNLGVAGYIVAVVSVIVAVIPLFSSK